MNFILVRRVILCHTKFILRRPKKKLREGERERERKRKEEEVSARVNPSDFLNVKLALWKFRRNLSTLYPTVSKNSHLHLERVASTPPLGYINNSGHEETNVAAEAIYLSLKTRFAIVSLNNIYLRTDLSIWVNYSCKKNKKISKKKN